MKYRALTQWAILISITAMFTQLVVIADDHVVLKDAGFEHELPHAQGGWQTFEESEISDNHARNGDRSMFNAGFSRSVAHHPFLIGNVSGSYQELPATPGSRWQLFGYGLTATKLEGAPAFGLIQVSFFDADGNDLGTVETAGTSTPAKTSGEINSQSPVDEWILLNTGVATAPENTVAIQAFTIFVDYSGSNKAQGVYFDDLRLSVLENGKASN